MSVKQPLVATQIKLNTIANKTRRLLIRNGGVNALRSLSRSFNIADDFGYWSDLCNKCNEEEVEVVHGKGVIRSEFVCALSENGCTLSDDEIDVIYTLFDRHGSQTIDPTDFMSALRCSVSLLRRTWVERVWNSFHKATVIDGDAKSIGSVKIVVLHQWYDASEHPDVKLHKRSEEDVLQEFKATFNTTTNPSGCVSVHEFTEYYTGVSTSIFDDHHFVALLRGVWNKLLDNIDKTKQVQCTDNCEREFNKQVGSQGTFLSSCMKTANADQISNTCRSNDSKVEYNIKHINNECRCVADDNNNDNKNNSTTTTTTITTKNVYSSFSNAHKKTLSAFNSLKENEEINLAKDGEAYLMSVITHIHRPHILKSPLAVRELALTLRKHDIDRQGFLSVDSFVSALCEHRLYFERLSCLCTLDTCHDNSVDYAYYLKLLLPQLPPARHMMLSRLWHTIFTNKDVFDRVKVRDLHRCYVEPNGEARDAFLNAWDVRKAHNGVISFEEFIEWYTPQSVNVDSDKDFECMLLKLWKPTV